MLYGNTDDGSSAQWVCDGSGVVVDNISIYGAERAPILEQINEYYGTSFTGWSDNEIYLRFGDTIPNWNAYEKIKLPIDQKLAIGMNGNSVFSIGRLIDTEFYITVKSANQGYWVDSEGRITSLGGPTSEAGGNYVKGILENKGYIVSEIIDNIVQYDIGEIVSDWESYEKIMQ